MVFRLRQHKLRSLWLHLLLPDEVLAQDQSSSSNSSERWRFCVQRTEGTFSRVAVDLAIEQTVNRDSKLKASGMVRLSKNPSARQKWVVTSHERADIVRCCRDMVAVRHCCSNVRLQKEMRAPRLARDERDVQKVLQTLSTWKDPFL